MSVRIRNGETKMKTTIYFIRHGQTQWNKEQRMQGWQNSNLTDLGKEQADLLGKKFKRENLQLDLFYSSPSPRALETVNIINQSLGVETLEEFGFQEINMGIWEGKTYPEIIEKNPEEWHNFWEKPEDFKADNKGETFEELSCRSFSSLKKAIKANEGKQIGIVSHRITIKSMIANLLGISKSELEDVEPNSVTKVSILDGVTTLEVYSDISHYEK